MEKKWDHLMAAEVESTRWATRMLVRRSQRMTTADTVK